MKKLLSFFVLFLGGVTLANADPIHPSDIPLDARPVPEYIDRSTAVIRIMNKAAGRATTATVPIGRSAEYEKLDLIIRSCKETPPFERKEHFMFIEINKKTAGDARVFSGWMSANDPGDNPLQDADYDLWLVRCE